MGVNRIGMPYWVQTKKLKQSDADYRGACLDAAIATLERLAEEAGR